MRAAQRAIALTPMPLFRYFRRRLRCRFSLFDAFFRFIDFDITLSAAIFFDTTLISLRRHFAAAASAAIYADIALALMIRCCLRRRHCCCRYCWPIFFAAAADMLSPSRLSMRFFRCCHVLPIV